MRVHAAAQCGSRFVDSVDQVPATRNYAAHQVRMSTEIFCSRMHDQVDAKFHGPLIDRCTEGPVNDGDQVVLFRERRHFFQIHNAQGGVCGGLQMNELRVGPNGMSMLIVFRRIDESSFHAQFRQPSTEKFRYAAIDVALRHDVIAAFDQGEDRGGDRGHSGGHGNRAQSAFKGCEVFFKRFSCRICGA